MLKVYNTLSRKKETFKPLKNKKVNLFVCGPTVYDYSHIGHARTYIIFDMIVGYLRVKGLNVTYLQNITDIDDKIIGRAEERKTNPKRLAKRFEKEYLKDMKLLKVNSVTKYARATEYISGIISQIERLIKNKFAYRIKDGIYYDVSKFKRYGRLSRRTIERAEDAISRIDESKSKKSKADFCLWKFPKPGEPKWESSFGYGRPGWHIEDTAITEKHFGFQYDIHGGARDLIFPHHEAEISQMEAISKKRPMAKYWLHTGFLTVNGKKMAKSEGNFITIRDFLKENRPELLRLFIFLNHYRSPIDYNQGKLNQAKRNLSRLEDFFERIKEKRPGKVLKESEFLNKYLETLEDDFNTPRFFSAIFDLIRDANKRFNQLSKKEIKEIYSLLVFTDKVFKIFSKKKLKISQDILKLTKQREKYRKEKNWQKADKARKEVESLGYRIEDTKKGPKIEKIIK
jgi:cysteinyl-tRNA synthetase